jgi:uncharacterized protein (TIGR02246 family)
MDTQPTRAEESSAEDEAAVRGLYAALLKQWNRRDAAGMAALFSEAGHLVGYDGSVINGQAAIAEHLAPIFADHPTPAYVGKVREVRFLTPDVAVLRAVSGLVPDGTADINPDLNAVQSLVAARHGGQWRAELYQNTPAAFHGRPEESADLTAELRALLAE